MEDAPILRARLAQAAPALSAALDESARIARNEWMPAMSTSKGSSNAYPHLRNVAGHLEHIVLAFEAYPESGFVPLTPGETYVALLAVLFHDYGRLDPMSKGRDGAEGVAHGSLSLEHLRVHHAELGIHTTEVAVLAGRIAACHEYEHPNRRSGGEPCDPPHSVGYAIGQLSDTTLDTVGTIRAPLLAGLVALADQMDAAYTRSIPEYLTEQQGGVIGHFRRHIQAVCVDPETRLVKTILTAPEIRPESTMKAARKSLRERAGDELPAGRYTINRPGNSSRPLTRKQTDAWKIRSEITLDWLPKRHRRRMLTLLAEGVLTLEDPGRTAPGRRKAYRIAMPRFGPHAIAFGNMHGNQCLLKQVAPVLARYGLVLESWLVEIDRRLFRRDGAETFEPILSGKLLVDAASAMWALSTHIFGSTSFSYEDVAAYLGDPSVHRVRVACRRVVAVVAGRSARCAPGPCQERPAPWSGATRWHWHGSTARGPGPCSYICREETIGWVGELRGPHG